MQMETRRLGDQPGSPRPKWQGRVERWGGFSKGDTSATLDRAGVDW